jgi:hypothetical protein
MGRAAQSSAPASPSHQTPFSQPALVPPFSTAASPLPSSSARAPCDLGRSHPCPTPPARKACHMTRRASALALAALALAGGATGAFFLLSFVATISFARSAGLAVVCARATAARLRFGRAWRPGQAAGDAVLHTRSCTGWRPTPPHRVLRVGGPAAARRGGRCVGGFAPHLRRRRWTRRLRRRATFPASAGRHAPLPRPCANAEGLAHIICAAIVGGARWRRPRPARWRGWAPRPSSDKQPRACRGASSVFIGRAPHQAA